MNESEIFLPEVHSFFLRPFLDEAPEKLGQGKLQQLLRQLGTEETKLRDQTAWVSLRFCEAFFERLVAGGADPAIFDRCGRLALSQKYIGILRPLFRAFGTPMFAYRQTAQSTARFNKVGEWVLKEVRLGFVDLEYRCRPGAPVERCKYICQARGAQLGAIPTMFDLLPAEVKHPSCLHAGGKVCRYELRWKEYGTRRASRLLLALGLPAGAALAAFFGGEGLALAAGAAGCGVTAWALARIVELQRRLAEQAADVTEGQDALARSVRFHEEQFAQLTEAKSEVDRKVEERTEEVVDANRKLATALQDMQALEQAERNFFANISHDLRTPLTLILAPLDELLADDAALPLTIRQSMETIQRSARQLRRLIDQLLDLEKIQAGRVELSRGPVDMRGLLQGVAERFSTIARKQSRTVDLSAPESARLISLDARWVDSAVTNLVSNALRFARTAVRIRLADCPEAAVVEVEDDGPGIPPEELSRIFDRFVQGGPPGERRGGTGLGLAIAREAARLHGGTLTVRSEVGVGTTFTVTLPRVLGLGTPAVAGGPPAPAPDDVPLMPTGIPDGDRRTWEGPSPDAPLVMVAEDDDDLRVFMARTLAAHYRVDVARDGEEGLALLRTRQPDAVICDVAMPKLDGYELCRLARADAATRLTPFLLVTARSHIDRVMEGLEAGANDYVTKPFHPRELVARLDAHLTLRRILKDAAHKERLVTLGLLAASVAHQVRNPLSALKNTVTALQRKVTREISPASPPMFALINECAGRIERFTKDLLDLARVEPAEAGPIKPAQGIESVIRLMSTNLPLTVTIDAALDWSIEVTGKPGDLNHVFMNLVDNALRAVGTAGKVKVSARGERGEFVFEVADSGPGVPADKREWIFEPFATTRSTDGTGLGLYIVKKIVLDHGGQIAVDQSELGGALFRVRIPIVLKELPRQDAIN